jgi:hypothetical protein
LSKSSFTRQRFSPPWLLFATSEYLAIGAEEHTEQLTRRVTVFRETQKIKDGPVMAVYQIAVAKGEMALTTMIVNVTACAELQDRDDDYLKAEGTYSRLNLPGLNNHKRTTMSPQRDRPLNDAECDRMDAGCN